LQSWGTENSQETATADQLEGARKRRQGSSWYDKQGNPKRSKGAKQRQWTQSFAEGKHPRTGVDTWTPIQRQGKCWIWTRETHWKAFDTYEEALAAKEGIYASRSPAPAEAAATPEAAKAAPTAYKSGLIAGLAPLWAKAAPPVKEFAYNQMRRTLEEQEYFCHGKLWDGNQCQATNSSMEDAPASTTNSKGCTRSSKGSSCTRRILCFGPTTDQGYATQA
jgi:hypothetical protein